MKTLIVEDNPTFRKMFKDILCKEFPALAVEEAVDGPEALEKVRTFAPKLVFLDIRLPGENGLNLAKKIKTNHPAIVIVMVTDFDLPEYREAAIDSGADEFLVKGTLSPGAIRILIKSIFPNGTLNEGIKDYP